MSKVVELLELYNPNGVFQSDLREVSSIIRGKRVTKRDVKESGDYPVISGGESPMGYYDTFNRDANTITIAQYGAAGYVDFQKNKFWANDVCYSILPFESVDNKYLYYTLKSKQNFIYSIRNTDAVPFSLPINTLYSIQIPLPHIKVQEEIVKILDSFTNLIDALNEELSLRQKQFEYYREKLLTFDDNTNMQKICNFATIQSGKNKERTDNGQFPLFGSTGLISRTNISVYEGDYILIARVGANAGFTYRVNGKFDVSDNTLIVTIIKNNTINIDYLYHCLIEQNLNKYAKGGGQPLVTSGELKNISIPIPSLAIQQSIVEKLDAFESLISSLKEEIVLRQKQNEYYREKLLNFN